MARIEFIHEASEQRPAFPETIEVRPWDLGGRHDQPFYIGSGLNYQADSNIWLEILYSVEGAQIFYTRNFLHHDWRFTLQEQLEHLDGLIESGEGAFGLGDILPETSLILQVEKDSYQLQEGAEPHEYQTITLKISVDTGAVFGFSAPGERFVEIKLYLDSVEEGIDFMRELVHELEAVHQGKHPDPACFPPGSSEWPLVWQLNRRAYDALAESYRGDYFAYPLLADAFSAWLDRLPAGGQLLDSGCGHGDPVIARLLERGFQVTGADFSPEMLKRARAQFPQAPFVQQSATQLDFQGTFDGACSFHSLLYLDPIDFYNAVYRLYQALKPGGFLFLCANDTGPDWRGDPFHFTLDHWMWGWHYGMEEAAGRLEEHGYFQVLDYQRVGWDEEKEAEFERQKAASSGKLERPPCSYAILARRAG